MQYPRRQVQIVALVEHMIGGISEHADIFKHCDAAELQSARDDYMAANIALTDAYSKVAAAAVDKQKKLNKLQQAMKKQIKLGMVDTCGNPVELTYIGWGGKRSPQQIEKPAQPTDLKIIAQGDAMVCLAWLKLKAGGPVRTYIIERRANNQDWTLAATALNNEAKLIHQPTGCKLEYRVKAINTVGETTPSNSVYVVL